MSTLLITACSDDQTVLEPTVPEGNSVTFTLRVPGYSRPSRAVDENGIGTLRVIYFSADGSYIDETGIDSDDINAEGNVYKVKLPLASRAARVQIVANHDRTIGGDASTATVTDDPNRLDKLVFHGSATIEELTRPNARVDLTRFCAKTEVSVESDDLEVLAIRMYGCPGAGTIAATGQGVPNLPAGLTYSGSGTDLALRVPFYHYEADAGHCCLIIKGTYKGVTGYYKAAYIADDGDGEELSILRNHRYLFTINGVNDYGWPTEKEALEAAPDNRLAVLLKDHNEEIFDMTACRDYELGVCQDVTVASDATVAQLRIFSSYTGEPPYSIAGGYPEWITGYSEAEADAVTDDDTRSQGTAYTIAFSLEPNAMSEEARTAEITVRAGDLSRTVRITQQGRDFKRDPDRKVLIYNLDGNPAGQDYFAFVDNSLQGARAEDMQQARNNGLHFAVYANTYHYTIPKKEGDRIMINSGNGRFTVTDQGSEWLVECTDRTDYRLWDGEFTIHNTATDISVTYDVFHRGLFHRLSGSYQIAGPEGDRSEGWFYYEQVTVTGSDGLTYHILDRNMGAACNGFYSPGSMRAVNDIRARGGYFRIANDKSDYTLINSLPPAGFSVPLSYHLENMGVHIVDPQSGTPAVTVADGAFREIYFPLTGFMEGTTHKDEIHGCLWSQSLLSGNQGFANDSPEFGYWFRYFDIYGSKFTISNMRIATRLNGNGIGQYKAMPVRCMHGPTPPDGWDLPDAPAGRTRIYCKNLAGWNTVYVYFSKNGTPYPFAKDAQNMIPTDNNSWYYDVPADADLIIFSAGDQTGTMLKRVIPDGSGDNRYNNLPEGRTIYCRNSAGWSQVYVHVWSEADKFDWTKWPGVQMKKDSSGRFYLEIPSDADHIKFNYNGAQSSNIALVPGQDTYDNNI